MKRPIVALYFAAALLTIPGTTLFAQNARTARPAPAPRPAATPRPAPAPVSRPAVASRPVNPVESRPVDPPSARPRFDHLNDEIAHIRRGIHSGELTRQEVARLKQELEVVKAHQQRALQDGMLTPHEKEILQKEINKLDRDIYQQTHDDQNQPDHDGPKSN